MKRSTFLRLASALAISFVLSCTSPTGMCGCPPALMHAEVHGQVRTGAGAPVHGAVIGITVFREQCGQGRADTVSQFMVPIRTDASGAYEARFSSPSLSGTVCLRVSATRGQGASADSAIVEGALVQMRGEREQPARVRVDVVFPGS